MVVRTTMTFKKIYIIPFSFFYSLKIEIKWRTIKKYCQAQDKRHIKKNKKERKRERKEKYEKYSR